MALSLAAMVLDRRAGRGEHLGLYERSFYLWMSASLAAVAMMLFIRV